MAAGVGHGQLEIGIGLLGALPGEIERLARRLVESAAAAVDVEDEIGILEPLGDQIALVFITVSSSPENSMTMSRRGR
jgi:hypothetical protein